MHWQAALFAAVWPPISSGEGWDAFSESPPAWQSLLESQHDIEELREIEHAVAKCIEENGKAGDVPERDAHEPGYPHLANREAAGLRKHPSEFFVAELDPVFDIRGAPAF